MIRVEEQPTNCKANFKLRSRVAAPDAANIEANVMGLHINEMVSEVTAESDSSAAAGAPKPATWEEIARTRDAEAQAARDRFRHAAEGYDD